jgi:hypothetical protein
MVHSAHFLFRVVGVSLEGVVWLMTDPPEYLRETPVLLRLWMRFLTSCASYT